MMDFDALASAADTTNTLALNNLLALRILFDKADPVQNIEQDLKDLFIYPERLHQSAAHEWKVFVKRALHNAHKAIERDDELSLPRLLHSLYTQKAAWCKRLFELAARALDHCERIHSAPNVTPITAQFSRFDKLIKNEKD